MHRTQIVAFLLLLLSWETLFASEFPPGNYQALGACEKQDLLWRQVQTSEHRNLPRLKSLGFIEMVKLTAQAVTKKKTETTDWAPEGWKKYLHAHGVLAKVEWKSVGEHPYTGAFKGSSCALLRLSVTFDPEGRKGFAPGLALKVLRADRPSGNISALYLLEGQGHDYNFFKNPLSNIVPMNFGAGPRWVHSIFRRATDYPEELLVTDLAKYNQNGQVIENLLAPRQIFFVPNSAVQFSSEPHDFRRDLLGLSEGLHLYDVHAVSEEFRENNYLEYKATEVSSFQAKSTKIGEIILKSKFLASEFGDERIFFNHEMRPKKN